MSTQPPTDPQVESTPEASKVAATAQPEKSSSQEAKPLSPNQKLRLSLAICTCCAFAFVSGVIALAPHWAGQLSLKQLVSIAFVTVCWSISMNKISGDSY